VAAPTSAPAAPTAGPALAVLPTPLKVRQGLLGSLGDGPILIALDRGYFTEAGLDVEDNRFDAATRMMQPLAADQLDVVSAALTAGLFNAFARDIDVRVVGDRGVETRGHGYNGLVVRQDLWDSGAVRSIPDLRGRKVGVAGIQAGSLAGLQFGMAVEAQGLRIEDFDVVDLTLPDTNAALANRSIEAAMQIEPLLALGLNI
jgi:NitT/TauT family transport system substrate-binding protein